MKKPLEVGAPKESIYEPTDTETTLERYLDNLGGRKNLYQAQKNKAIFRFLKNEQFFGKKILDAGCGVGLWTAYFLNRGAIVTSCDMREHFIEAARRYIDSTGLGNDRVTFVCCDIIDFLNFYPKEQFDFVFAKDLIEHIHDDQMFLQKVYEVTTKQGKLFISTQNAFSLNYLIEGFIRRLKGDKRWKGWDPTHVRFYTPFNLNKKLLKAGFRPMYWYSMYHIPYKVICSVIARIIGKSISCECPILHFLEKYGEHFPLNKTGWNLGVISRKL